MKWPKPSRLCSKLRHPRAYIALRIGLAIFTASITVGCDPVGENYYEGRSQARIDLGKKPLNIAIADNARFPEFSDYTHLLHTRYQIGCCIYSLPANRKAEEAWVRGYNEVSSLEIYRRFGTNILNQTMADAQKQKDQ